MWCIFFTKLTTVGGGLLGRCFCSDPIKQIWGNLLFFKSHLTELNFELFFNPLFLILSDTPKNLSKALEISLDDHQQKTPTDNDFEIEEITIDDNIENYDHQELEMIEHVAQANEVTTEILNATTDDDQEISNVTTDLDPSSQLQHTQHSSEHDSDVAKPKPKRKRKRNPRQRVISKDVQNIQIIQNIQNIPTISDSLTCRKCDIEYPDRDSLVKHIVDHHYESKPGPFRPYHCHICLRNMSSRKSHRAPQSKPP